MAALALLLGLSGCGRPGGRERSDDLLVFAGAAGQPALEEIGALFEKETGVRVNLTFGGSGSVLAQMELSGRGDVYIPGSPDYIVIGLRKKLLVPGSERIVAYLVPAIVTPAGNPAGVRGLDDLTRPGLRVGLGNPESVCLGLYSVELLERNGLLEEVLENTVTFAESCARTANLAALGQVDAVIGWRVFHYWNPARMDWIPIEPERIPRLAYIPVAIAASARDPELAQRFIDFVLSERSGEVYGRYGYLVSREAAAEFAPGAAIGGEYTLPAGYFQIVKERFGGK